LTVADVAAELGVSTATVKRRIARGDLPAFRDGARIVRIRRVDFDRYVAERLERRRSNGAVTQPAGRLLREGERLWD
jgi:excisionase family DNA binding protein